MQQITVSIATAAKSIGIGQTKLYELIKNGRLTTVKIGRRTLVRVDSIGALLSDGEAGH